MHEQCAIATALTQQCDPGAANQNAAKKAYEAHRCEDFRSDEAKPQRIRSVSKELGPERKK